MNYIFFNQQFLIRSSSVRLQPCFVEFSHWQVWTEVWDQEIDIFNNHPKWKQAHILMLIFSFDTVLMFIWSCSSRSKVPVWPFLVASFFVGAYALIPYFVLWKPPPPAVEEEELTNWPLNFLDSKITAVVRN